MPLPTYWLSFHAGYACRDSGVCCSSGWDIDIERTRVPPIARALADGRIEAPARWYRQVPGAPADVAGVLAATGMGHCVFHRDASCAIHGTLGHAAMPSACQHFPRVVLIDARGVFVTLSHYCPTAASLLFDVVGPVAVIEGPPALPAGELPEGLDARDALPPLETPRRLLDLERYAAWERQAVTMLTTAAEPEAVFTALDPTGPIPSDESLFDIARQAVVPPFGWPPFTTSPAGALRDDGLVVGRYLAAHAFAAWTAYQGNGLCCTVLYLRLVLSVLKSEHARGAALVEAIRQSDLLLRHLVDRQRLADRLSEIAAR